MMKKKMDIIDQKRLELNTYVAQYNSAISLITGTIDSLGSISQNMADKIGEIAAYQRDLDATKAGLAEAKAKNDRVMENFKRLVGEV